MRPNGTVSPTARDPFVVAVEEVRLLGHDVADDDRIDTNLGRELDCERLRGVEQSCLCRPVGHGPRRGPDTAHARDIHDIAAVFLTLHHRVGLLRAHQRSREVQRDDPGSETRRRGRGIGRRRAAGVVDQHVERAETICRGCDHSIDLVRFAHVGSDEQPPDREVFGLVPAADGNVRASFGETQRDPPPNPATAARDEHDAAVEARELGSVVHGGGVYDLEPGCRGPASQVTSSRSNLIAICPHRHTSRAMRCLGCATPVRSDETSNFADGSSIVPDADLVIRRGRDRPIFDRRGERTRRDCAPVRCERRGRGAGNAPQPDGAVDGHLAAVREVRVQSG